MDDDWHDGERTLLFILLVRIEIMDVSKNYEPSICIQDINIENRRYNRRKFYCTFN